MMQLAEVKTNADNNEGVLGLIHTHPQHGLFLSSIDQHNLYKFQSEVPLSVSGVYSGMFI